MALSKKLRFEVFKRDKFACQYCGRCAPDVVLNCDHIHPTSKGGKDDILNLVTSCFDCNQGKKVRLLDDNTVIEKQKAQLDALQERREQLEMMLEWQKGLIGLQDDTVFKVAEFWAEIANPYSLTDSGMDSLRKLLKKFGASEVVEAIRRSADTHLVREEGMATSASVQESWDKVGMYCVVARRDKENPHLKQIYYIRGILRKRLSYVNDHEAIALMAEAVKYDIDLDGLTGFAKQVRNWTAFRESLTDYIQQRRTQ